MNKKKLVDKIISSLFRESRKVDSQRSYIAMRNYLGQTVYINNFHEKKYINIDLDNMSEGIYFLNIISDNGMSFTQQIIYRK